MTTVAHLLANYSLEEEYNINDCPLLDVAPTGLLQGNTYDVLSGEDDIIFQFTIYADEIKEVYLVFPGYQVAVVPKQIELEKWAVCLQFPGIAIGAFCFHKYLYLYLPGAVNVHRVVRLSKTFVSKDRKIIGNEFLKSAGKISFEIYGCLDTQVPPSLQTCFVHDSY